MSAAEALVGFTHVDDKGRVSLTKPVRTALGLGTGSSLAWVKVGSAIVLIPQDEHLEKIMDAAALALERARISVQDLLDELPAARDTVVAEQYGEDFLRTLARLREEQRTASPG